MAEVAMAEGTTWILKDKRENPIKQKREPIVVPFFVLNIVILFVTFGLFSGTFLLKDFK